MTKRNFLLVGVMLVIALSGCGANKENTEAEKLRQQIAQLEQKVSELESRNNSDGHDQDDVYDQRETVQEEAVQEKTVQEKTVQEEAGSREVVTAEKEPALETTYTMEELTNMVDAFVDKADAALPNGSVSESTEQFFALKQEEKQIDHCLDIHEDELESLYHAGSITRDDYRILERELEALEDRLDDAEDKLEYIFGIDD